MYMRKINEFIKYTCRGYKYAPESFEAYKVLIDRNCGNHSYIKLKFSREQVSKIGCVCLEKGKDAARQLIKRYDRANEKKVKKFITYGFFDADNKTTYHFTRQLYCQPDAPINTRLHIYKEFKSYLKDMGCKVVKYSQCKLDGHYNPINEETVYALVDITKPVIIKLNAA